MQNLSVSRVALLALALSLLFAACSSDSTESTGGSAAAAKDGGGPATGGSSGSGGGSATGGAATGGGPAYDPVVVAKCGISAGDDRCRSCLAVNCCDDAKACLADAACSDAFDTYQACIKDPATIDPSLCFSSFFRAARGDGGASGPLPLCIISGCEVCGAPSVL